MAAPVAERIHSLVKGHATEATSTSPAASGADSDAAVKRRESDVRGPVEGSTARSRSREELNALLGRVFMLVGRGRVAAFEDVYDLVARDLFGYLRGVLGSAADAEDVLQEVFAKLAAQGPRLLGVEKPLGYVFAIARNEAFLMKKRSREHDALAEAPLLEEIAAPESPRTAITAAEAEKALGALPAEWREIVILKIYEGFTFAEIGELTDTSPNAVASRYRYALAKLAGKLRAR